MRRDVATAAMAVTLVLVASQALYAYMVGAL
jgi:hypothetical protein